MTWGDTRLAARVARHRPAEAAHAYGFAPARLARSLNCVLFRALQALAKLTSARRGAGISPDLAAEDTYNPKQPGSSAPATLNYRPGTAHRREPAGNRRRHPLTLMSAQIAEHLSVMSKSMMCSSPGRMDALRLRLPPPDIMPPNEECGGGLFWQTAPSVQAWYCSACMITTRICTAMPQL